MTFKEPEWGYCIPPSCTEFNYDGSSCECGRADCPMPKMWKEHWEVWKPLLSRQESFFEKYDICIVALCAFILGLII